jgi:hypothetical protein
MIRVSSIYPVIISKVPFHTARTSPGIRKVFYSSISNKKALTSKQEENDKNVSTEGSAPIEPFDLKKLSPEIQQIFEEAKKIAKNRQIAMEGPPSDSLPSLLAMHIKNNKD